MMQGEFCELILVERFYLLEGLTSVQKYHQSYDVIYIYIDLIFYIITLWCYLYIFRSYIL